MKRFLFVFASIVLFQFAIADASAHKYGNITVSSVTKVYDGDTFTVNIANVHPIIGEAISIRIIGIDTPELKSKNPKTKAKACQARDYVANRLHQAKVIELVNIQRDKYFRILAEVFVDGINLGDELIEVGHAQPYDGGTKPCWD